MKDGTSVEVDVVKTKPASPVVTVPDPDDDPVTPVKTWGEVGGTVQFRIDSISYPEFSIKFIGPNPMNDEEHFIVSGNKLEPRAFKLNTAGDYFYTVSYSPLTLGPYVLVVAACRWCKP